MITWEEKCTHLLGARIQVLKFSGENPHRMTSMTCINITSAWYLPPYAMKDKAASLFYFVDLFGHLHKCHQNMLLLRPGWVIWWKKQLRCKSSCLRASWRQLNAVSQSFFFMILFLFCCRVCGTKAGTHLWCISLSLHFRKSSVGTAHVSSWVPSLPPAAGPGSKKASIVPLTFVPITAGAASLPPQHPTSTNLAILGHTGCTGEDSHLCWCCLILDIVVISPTGKYSQWEHSFRTTTVTSQVRHDSVQGEMGSFSTLGTVFFPLNVTKSRKRLFVCQSIPSALTAGGQLCKTTKAGNDA